MKKRDMVLIAGLVVIIVIMGGSMRKPLDHQDKVSEVEFSFEDLDELEEKITGLSFEDLEGLETETLLGFSESDLDNLEEALSGLSFDDLEGLSDN